MGRSAFRVAGFCGNCGSYDVTPIESRPGAFPPAPSSLMSGPLQHLHF
ncbi:MAG: hypothetical protein M3Z33_02065 [Actinomycetota bacterium]|nr:hypothetical protein [Actinomycetota bacterium]